MKKIISAVLITLGGLSAQTPQAPNPTQQTNAQIAAENNARMAAGQSPIYRVSVVEGATKAVNFRSRGGATKLDFKGTTLLPKASGEAKVESKQGYIEVEVEFDELKSATMFGSEYLTYVMWAITPEGRATNMGEVLLNGNRSKLNVTTELQTFGMIVTAEPYFGVTQPSDVVVLENVIRADTRGAITAVDAKYELLKRGQYIFNANPSEVKPVKLDSNIPLSLYEARNAVLIARWTGASNYAPDSYAKAVKSLATAEGYLTRKAGKKPIETVSREAVQMAEDARIITIKKIEEERLTNERQAGAARELLAENGRAAAQSEAARVSQDAERARLAAQAEAQRISRERDSQNITAQNEADRLKRDSDFKIAAAKVEADRLANVNAAQANAAKVEADRLARVNQIERTAAQTEADRLKRINDAQVLTAKNEADNLKRINDAQALTAKNEADNLKRINDAQLAAAKNEADRLKAENDAQKLRAQAELDRAAAAKTQADVEKAQLRAQLMTQFNAILQTRDTARGLIVNMSDVLFGTGESALRPAAREKLAKVAGILSGHPGLHMQVEGYTDSVGSDEYNQSLSERRATSVSDYLIKTGIPTASVSSKGFGETLPVASNDTSSGRQQNRRVELVVSGEIIGSDIRPAVILAAQ
ncbi:MAG: OmpA family protein [Bryobacteraceae bacterium]